MSTPDLRNCHRVKAFKESSRRILRRGQIILVYYNNSAAHWYK